MKQFFMIVLLLAIGAGTTDILYTIHADRDQLDVTQGEVESFDVNANRRYDAIGEAVTRSDEHTQTQINALRKDTQAQIKDSQDRTINMLKEELAALKTIDQKLDKLNSADAALTTGTSEIEASNERLRRELVAVQNRVDLVLTELHHWHFDKDFGLDPRKNSR